MCKSKNFSKNKNSSKVQVKVTKCSSVLFPLPSSDYCACPDTDNVKIWQCLSLVAVTWYHFFFLFFNRLHSCFRRSVCCEHFSFRELPITPCVRKHLTRESLVILRFAGVLPVPLLTARGLCKSFVCMFVTQPHAYRHKSSGRQVIVGMYSLAAPCSQPRRISIHCWKLPFGGFITFWNLENENWE